MELHDRPAYPRWLAVLLTFAVIALVGLFAYNFGVAQGAAQGGAVVTAPAAPGSAVAPVFVYPRHWGWGWGFGFSPLFALFWIFLFFALLRRLWWGPRWYRRCGYYGHPYYDRYYERPDLDEWHRRAHGQQPPPPTTTQL